jgi:hypothetical protein
VAMQITVLVGGREEAEAEEQSRRTASKRKQPRRVGRPVKPLSQPPRRQQSCLVRGKQSIQVAVIRAEALPLGYVVSEPWPTQTYRPRKPTGQQGTKSKKREANRSYKQRRRARGNEEDRKRVRESVQERRNKQRQARRATKANRKAKLLQEQEAERKCLQQEQATRRIQRREEHQRQKQEEQAHKREGRIRAREEGEQRREERRLWHEELQRERAIRQLRQVERAARRSSLAPGSPSASSKKVALQQALTEPPEPP